MNGLPRPNALVIVAAGKTFSSYVRSDFSERARVRSPMPGARLDRIVVYQGVV